MLEYLGERLNEGLYQQRLAEYEVCSPSPLELVLRCLSSPHGHSSDQPDHAYRTPGTFT